MPPPIPFPGATGVPLVGQACTIIAHTQAAIAICNCDGKTVFQVDGVNTVGQCRACGRAYRITMSHYDAATGQGTVALSVIAVPAGLGEPLVAKPS